MSRMTGLDSYSVPITGYGIGLMGDVKPGVYIENWDGIRMEENVPVGNHETVFLSTYCQPW
jgi:hypothetical protein